MKRFVLLVCGLMIINLGFTQNKDTTAVDSMYNLFQVIDKADGVILKMGNKELMSVKEHTSGVEIKVNEKSFFKVSENSNGVSIKAFNDQIFDSVKNQNISMNEDQIAREVNETIKQIEKEIDEHMNEVVPPREGGDINMDIHAKRGKKAEEEIKNKDSTQVRIGNMEINVIEDDDGNTRVDITRDNDDKNKEKKEEKNKKFQGHWKGIELGLNGYLNSDYGTTVPNEYSYLDLYSSKSINFNLNLPHLDIGLIGKQFGLVSGLGLEWMNFRFDNQTTFITDELGNIKRDTTAPADLDKTKLVTTYLTMPVLLEVQFPRAKQAYLQVGVIGGLKIASRTKIVYREDGQKEKDKDKGDFSIIPLRYGFTARAGYEEFGVYANYYPVGLFENNRGPDIYPYAVGIHFGF